MLNDSKTKYCPKCKQDKLLVGFNKDRATKSGYHGWCKKCQLEKGRLYRKQPEIRKRINEKQNKNNVKRYNTNKEFRTMKKEASRGYWLKSQYSLSLEEYDIMVEQQSGCCKICGIPQSELKQRLVVDHNHKTGEVRGLLCTACNVRVGWYENWYKKQKINLKNYLGE